MHLQRFTRLLKEKVRCERLENLEGCVCRSQPQPLSAFVPFLMLVVPAIVLLLFNIEKKVHAPFCASIYGLNPKPVVVGLVGIVIRQFGKQLDDTSEPCSKTAAWSKTQTSDSTKNSPKHPSTRSPLFVSFLSA